MSGCLAVFLFLAVVLAVGYLARERPVALRGCVTLVVAGAAALIGALMALAGSPSGGLAFGTAVVMAIIGSAMLVFGFVAPTASQREVARLEAQAAPEAERLWDRPHRGLSDDDVRFVSEWHPDTEARLRAGRLLRERHERRRAEESERRREREARETRRPVRARGLPDHYAVLGISRHATAEEVSRAYRKAMSTHHPDHGGDEEKAKRINEAYDTLKDEARRRRYDALLRYGAAG